MSPAPAPVATMLASIRSSPVYVSLAGILIVISLVVLAVPIRASRRIRARDSAATPPRSVSPARPQEKPLLLDLNRAAPGATVDAHPVAAAAAEKKLRSPSVTEILTSLIPRSKNPAVAAVSERPAQTEPVTNRTPGEIANYGHFPDYSALSGVPLPVPYEKFDIERALPRPYRPFRWAYHQTMCTYRRKAWIKYPNPD